MQNPSAPAQPLPRLQAIAFLLAMGVVFGANHVAARVAFDHGVGLLTAVLVRAGVTALVLALLLRFLGMPLRVTPSQRPWLLLLGGIIALQSLLLYAAVARAPVAVALLGFNTYPALYALLVWALGGARPTRRSGLLMLMILLGLVLALDVWPIWQAGRAGLSSATQGLGVLLALAAAAVFAGALWVTEQRLHALAGPLRSFCVMSIVFVGMLLAGSASVIPGGMAWPVDAPGWWGLALLTLCYGSAFSLVFMLLPRLDMARNGPASNIEPIAALGLGYVVLDQALKPTQLVGAVMVVGAIVLLALGSGRKA